MSKTTKPRNARTNENTSESSERQISPVSVPADIKHPRYARAYAHGFNAARSGKYLDFVAPAYRWAIARGWKDGEKARAAVQLAATPF